MLNIKSRISLTRKSKTLISALKRKQVNFTPASWGKIDNEVKSEISGRLLLNQRLKCAYCERYLIALGHEIDHFAHKADYPEFTFTSTNLFYSCKFCNSPGRKGQKRTIANLSTQYQNCTFSIVHPFYHDPTAEIVFSDPDRIYFDLVNCTQLGRDTITFFGWDDLIYSVIRSRILINERLNPLASLEELKLIQESIAYRK